MLGGIEASVTVTTMPYLVIHTDCKHFYSFLRRSRMLGEVETSDPAAASLSAQARGWCLPVLGEGGGDQVGACRSFGGGGARAPTPGNATSVCVVLGARRPPALSGPMPAAPLPSPRFTDSDGTAQQRGFHPDRGGRRASSAL